LGAAVFGWTESVVPVDIQLGGEIDITNARALGEALCKSLSRRQLPITVDLAEVTFIDSSAIAMMLHVHKHAEALDASVSWSNPRPQAWQVLHITGVDQVLRIHR
jgi:anti-anti-sigma factor